MGIRRIFRWTNSSPEGRIHPDTVVRRQHVSLGDLRRVTPFSRVFGFDRGTPVDRPYIEGFLARNAADVRGRVLEVKNDSYTRRFGGPRVTSSDVLDVDQRNARATLIDDLASGMQLPTDAFDCIVLTQTLQLVFDVRSAIKTVHRILKPGGVALVTVPGITQIPRAEAASWYWSFTESSTRRLFESAFGNGQVRVETHGNVLAAAAFLYGLAAQELRDDEMDAVDPDYPVTIAIRAAKAQTT
jgi:SAM-dependent methyltransferase